MPGPDSPAPLTAESLLGGRYRIVRPVASGGMAAVWEGRDEVLARAVAIKVLHSHLAVDQIFLERFRREAISAARLSHPNIVATFDAGTAANGTAYIVMELVRGATLRRYLADGGLPIGLSIGISIQIADALRHAHSAGLVHRDIKPANVLLCNGDEDRIPQVKVTDFGIAKAAAGVGHELTRTGMVVGTPKYLSPEQVAGREPDARADLYALGVVLFEMLTGDPPFTGPTDMATALARLDGPAPRVSERRWDIPPALDHLVTALLAVDPDARPPTAAAVRVALAAIEPSIRRGGDLATAVASDPTLATRVSNGAATAQGDRTTIAPGQSTGTRTLPSRGGTAQFPPAGGAGGAARRVGPGGAGGAAGRGAAAPAPRRPRRSRWLGRVVGALVVLTVVVAAVILSQQDTDSTARTPAAIQVGGGTPLAAPSSIQDVSVFHTERDADDAARVGYAHDGNPATLWQTDRYYTHDFGRLRHGLGLAITLKGKHHLNQLRVQSESRGWSAQVYLASAVPAQASLVPWGQPVAVKHAIDGSVTFDLGGRDAGAILLWITDLGPADQVGVTELSVS